MKRGKFIVIDGIDGSGKTTQIRMLQKMLGKHAVYARDPGGTAAGETIRALLLGKEKFSKLSTLFLFLAARAALVDEVIEPALKRGKIVISDRFDSSTYAYQVVAGKDKRVAPIITAFAEHGLQQSKPDAYIILDTNPVEARKRLAQKPGELNAYDKKPLSYHRAVRAGYKQFKPKGTKVYFVNADRTRDEVFADVSTLVKRIIG